MASKPMNADRQNVFNALRKTYWKAAHREICTMILFFSDVLDHGRRTENFLAMDFAELECENFTKMFDLWLGGQQQGWKGFDTSLLYKETIERGRERISVHGLTATELLARKLHILARRLLQSSSFLDVDVFYEPVMPILPSVGQALPLLERTKIQKTNSSLRCTALRGMRCAVCGTLIRVETYLECGKGCTDDKSEVLPTQLIDDAGSTIELERLTESLGPSPLRLCLTCNLGDVNLEPCARDHWQRQSARKAKDEASGSSKEKGAPEATGFSSGKSILKDFLFPERAARNFQRKLSHLEDIKYLQRNEANSNQANNNTRLWASILKAESLLVGLGPETSLWASYDGTIGLAFEQMTRMIKLLRSNITPAGAYHLSLKFGTLLIESGVDKLEVGGKVYTTKRGILVSPRFSPSLLADKKSAAVLLYDPSDRLEENKQLICFSTCCNLYLAEDNKGQYKRRRVELVRRPIIEKGGLACMKVVYGAAFSGYADSKVTEEEATIEALVIEALSFHRAPYRSKDADSQRQALRKAADHVLAVLQSAIEEEVDKYLNRLVEVFLDPDTKITWSALSNNCQHLVDKLLQGKDFEYFFPRLPKQMGSVTNPMPKVDWPQYLMSFSDRISGHHVSLQQPNSFMTRFLSRTRFGGDVAEFLETQTHDMNTSRKYATLLLKQGALEDIEDRTAAFNELWEMPRDTLSILQFHLWRDRSRYASSAGCLSQHDWMENRLLLLLLSDIVASLSGALGASLLSLFKTNPDLVSRIILPKARVLGTARVGERVRILQLPGKQIIYFIESKVDDVLEKLFEAPEHEISIFTEIIRKAFLHWQSLPKKFLSDELTNTIGKFLARLSGLSRRPKRGFQNVCGGSSSQIISITIQQVIRLYEIRKRDDWVHLELEGYTMVLQLFRKSKTIRES